MPDEALITTVAFVGFCWAWGVALLAYAVWENYR